ncbi:MAG: hypothetical protein HY303_01130 [Candidatus Wallbacteria bacterium]|nr:hypothetical protein [Candidatus Wallbacteria bacterium]
MKRLIRKALLPALFMASLAVLPAPACPNCKSAVLTDLQGKPLPVEQGRNYSQGMNYSIYFMLGSIYAVFGGVAFVIARAYRNFEPGMRPGASSQALPAQAQTTPSA